MGTNYYAVRNRPTCSRPIHIGKASMGWMFLFEAKNENWSDPPVVWNSWDQVKDWLYEYTVKSTEFAIIDEYDRVISYDDFLQMVEERQEDEICRSNPRNFEFCRNVNGYRFDDTEFS